MLLNFSIGDEIINTQPKFKGGTWRDRLSAKKLSRRRQQRANLPLSEQHEKPQPKNPNKVTVGGSHRAKRPRLDSESDAARSPSAYAPAPPQQHQQPTGKSAAAGKPSTAEKPREVVSSLFSYNPVAKTAEPAANIDDNNAEPAKPSNAPLVDGIDTFTSLGLSPPLAVHLMMKLQLKNPTAIQKSAIPQMLKEDCDAFIQAQTGSGKTLAYLLPIIQQLMSVTNGDGGQGSIHRDSGLHAIVLAPTRELCKQISVVLDSLLHFAHRLVAGTVIGGEKKKSEKARLRKGLNILVATPGRMADHLENTKALDISKVRWLILDEGDRLMDLGFEKEIQGIVRMLNTRQRPFKTPGLPSRRVTVLCSATLKMNVQRLGEISLKDAVHIQADPSEEEVDGDNKESEFLAPAQLRQNYAIVASKLRLVALTALLKRTFTRKGSVMKAIIFVSCSDSVDFHFEVFARNSSSDTTISTSDPHRTITQASAFSNPTNPVFLHKLHGNLPQHVRTSTLTSFARQSSASVLICTDVAARGLDLPNVDYVIEYDPPYAAEDHLHRIGRTARVGRDGRAMIFLLPGPEEGYVDILRSGYRDRRTPNVSRTDVDELLRRGFGGNTDAAAAGWEDRATEWQLELERWALEHPPMLELARRAYQSHVRAYATHVAAERHMFNIKGLHLGHLAKSFALRDRPAKINVPGLRQGQEETKRDFKTSRSAPGGDSAAPGESRAKRKAAKLGDADDELPGGADMAEATRKMKAKLKMMSAGAASEFNIA